MAILFTPGKKIKTYYDSLFNCIIQYYFYFCSNFMGSVYTATLIRIKCILSSKYTKFYHINSALFSVIKFLHYILSMLSFFLNSFQMNCIYISILTIDTVTKHFNRNLSIEIPNKQVRGDSEVNDKENDFNLINVFSIHCLSTRYIKRQYFMNDCS